MKKLILIVVAVPVVAWFVLWIVATSLQRSVSARPWPDGLGSLDSVPARYPERDADTPAAVALTRLAAPLGVDAIRQPLREYLDAQLVRPSSAIDPPPPALAAYLAEHRAQLAAVRAQLLAGAPIAWKTQLSKGFEAPVPNLTAQMALTRLLVADALVNAHDPAAWDDLHAVWQLTGALRPRPDLISQIIAQAMERMTNAAAAKLPPPEPAWFAELRVIDYRRDVLASLQAEAWAWTHLPGAGGRLASPYIRLSAADVAEHMRTAFLARAASSACDVAGDPFGEDVANAIPWWNVLGRIAVPNLSAYWQRASRAVAEAELTTKVLQLRAGETPSPWSRCSDGQWLVTESSVKFSRKLRVPKTGISYPLEYASLNARQ